VSYAPIIGGVIGGAVGVAIASFIFVLVLRRMRKATPQTVEVPQSEMRQLDGITKLRLLGEGKVKSWVSLTTAGHFGSVFLGEWNGTSVVGIWSEVCNLDRQ
jgi:hypothetical protein